MELVFVSLGYAIRGRGLELTGAAAVGEELRAGWGGARVSLELFDSKRARLIIGVGLSVGGGSRNGESLGLLVAIEPRAALRFPSEHFGNLTAAVGWFKPLKTNDTGLQSGGVLATLEWVPIPGDR